MSPRKEPVRTKSEATLLRMRPEDKRDLQRLAELHGIAMADVVTMLVRKEMRREGLRLKAE